MDFERAGPRSQKVRCSECGRTGWGPYADQARVGDGLDEAGLYSPWQRVCLRGHAPCPKCGTMLSVKLDGTPRTHTRCPR